MRIIVGAVFDGVQWQHGHGWRRPAKAVDVIVEERPELGATVEGRLVDLIDPDSYTALAIARRDAFGGEAYLAIGVRPPPSREI
jgi:hypothetical protein